MKRSDYATFAKVGVVNAIKEYSVIRGVLIDGVTDAYLILKNN